jgi:hypothetical protein
LIQELRQRLLWIIALAVGLTALGAAQTASAYTFGSTVQASGPEETVFDYSTMACSTLDIPDSAPVAFRDASGRVQLISTHSENRRMIGPDLGHLQHKCGVVLSSSLNPDPAAFDDRQWITAVYTTDGNIVYALLHEEYQGFRHPGMCSSQQFPWCLENAITLATSTDGGETYSYSRPPSHVVASNPYPYAQVLGPHGYSASNIVRRAADGYYYTMVNALAYQAQQYGTCVMRTRDLSDPTSWRAWDGSAFTVRFINPNLEPSLPPAEHVCAPVALSQLGAMNQNLSFSTYFHKFILIGTEFDPVTKDTVPGFYYSLSDDLIHWTTRSLLMETELPWTYQCGDPNPTLYPAILDPDSNSRNFETTDQQVYLFFTRQSWVSCAQTLDRDLVRIPIQFTGSASSPTAALAVSPNAAQVGEQVRFDASASGDSNGVIADHKWDLDGNGSFETDTGADPTVSHSYDRPGTVSVAVRVFDGGGNSADATQTVTIAKCHGKTASCTQAGCKHRHGCAAKRKH